MNSNFFTKIFIFIICVALGFLLPSYLRQDLDDTSFVTLNSIVELKTQINNTKNEITSIKQSIANEKIKLKDIESAVSKGEVSDLIQNEILKIKRLSGFEDLEGPGVLIKIADSEETIISEYDQEYYDIVHDIYLSNLVNDLKNHGAEAISINGQRIVSTSEINCGGPVIRINKRSITNPFIIRAIGDPQKLYSAISGPKGYGTFLKDYFNLKVKTQISDNIYISKYNKNLEFKYATKTKEGE